MGIFIVSDNNESSLTMIQILEMCVGTCNCWNGRSLGAF